MSNKSLLFYCLSNSLRSNFGFNAQMAATRGIKMKLDDLLSNYRDMAMFEGHKVVAPESHGMDGDTPLHIIALDGDVDMLEKILPFVSEIDVAGDCGNTPLHYAINWGHPKIVKILIENGADPFRENDYGDTPFLAMHGKAVFEHIYNDIIDSQRK